MRGIRYTPWVVVLLLLVSISATTTVFAQDRNKPILDITGIDIDDFPVIRVSIFGSNLNGNLNSLPVTLSEDRVAQTVQNSESVDVGIQVAFIIDASSNILTVGNTGAPRITEVATAVDRFVQLGVLSAETDWLSAHTIGSSENDFQTLVGWERDHQAVANTLLQYRPEANAVNTPLFSLIKFGLDQIESSPADTNLRRHMVVFSDGFDALSAVQIDDVVNRSNRMDVTIHTILIGPETNERRQNLQRIADVTGGRYLVLAANDSTEVLWRELAGERTQRILTYRMMEAQPREIQVRFNLPDGSDLEDTQEFPFVPARAPEIAITSPEGGSTVERIADAADAAVETMQPAVLPIQSAVTWPDGHPRRLQRVEYEIGGITQIDQEEPFDTFELPITELGEGNYTLRVFAVDELGLRGESIPVSFRITLVLPGAVPPVGEGLETTGTITGGDVISGAISGVMSPTTTVTATTPMTGTDMVTGTTLAGFMPTGFLGTQLLDDGNRVAWVGGRVVLINRTTILLTVFPLIALLAFLVYGSRRRGNRSIPDYGQPYSLQNLESKSQPLPADVESTVPVAQFDIEDDATEPVRVPDFIAPAHLMLVDGGRQGGNHLPNKLSIEGGREVRIGRKSNHCDIVIDDKRVSRLHAAISEEGDGHFHIRDEGSAGGTFVNRRKLRAADNRILRHGDIINFNDIAYRFELTSESDKFDQTEPAATSLEATEVGVPESEVAPPSTDGGASAQPNNTVSNDGSSELHG